MRRALLLIFALPGLGQAEKTPDVWEPLSFLVGSWEGTGKGQPGNSTIEREYQFVLNGKVSSG